MNGARGARGLVIAAPGSGAGKTTVTLGLLSALRRRGVAVQPYKCGPDYIDPGHHGRAAGRESFNLDTWAMGAEAIAATVAATSADADLAIAEGVMGLFDGVNDKGRSGRGATADVAALLGWPVVLVLDVSAQAETAAAVALGCASYRSDIEIAGVILNRVGSERHLALIRPALERIGIKVLGGIGRNSQIRVPERHLGLVQAVEMNDDGERMTALAEHVGSAVDLDALTRIARSARPIETSGSSADATFWSRPPGQRIALARDAAFSFTYAHALRAWREAGAEIVPFSPLANEAPRGDANAVWLPGGYPELHGGVLAAADRFLGGLRALASRAVPIHGECGGYMVLGDGIEDADGNRHAMAGLLKLETSFAKRRLHLGYRRARLLSDCVLGERGAMLYGHEFHYASVVAHDDEPLFECHLAGRGEVETTGARRGSVTGSFFHLIDGDANGDAGE
jgi:cobyrinic acid a,c-diamide synthase